MFWLRISNQDSMLFTTYLTNQGVNGGLHIHNGPNLFKINKYNFVHLIFIASFPLFLTIFVEDSYLSYLNRECIKINNAIFKKVFYPRCTYINLKWKVSNSARWNDAKKYIKISLVINRTRRKKLENETYHILKCLHSC